MDNNTNKCGNCGKELPTGAQFCPNCGANTVNSNISTSTNQTLSRKTGNKHKRKKWPFVVILLVLIIAGGVIGGLKILNGKKNETQKPTTVGELMQSEGWNFYATVKPDLYRADYQTLDEDCLGTVDLYYKDNGDVRVVCYTDGNRNNVKLSGLESRLQNSANEWIHGYLVFNDYEVTAYPFREFHYDSSNNRYRTYYYNSMAPVKNSANKLYFNL